MNMIPDHLSSMYPDQTEQLGAVAARIAQLQKSGVSDPKQIGMIMTQELQMNPHAASPAALYSMLNYLKQNSQTAKAPPPASIAVQIAQKTLQSAQAAQQPQRLGLDQLQALMQPPQPPQGGPPQMPNGAAGPPGMPQGAPQPPPPAQHMREGGIAGLPVHNIGNYAGGGIVAFDEGGDIQSQLMLDQMIDKMGQPTAKMAEGGSTKDTDENTYWNAVKYRIGELTGQHHVGQGMAEQAAQAIGGRKKQIDDAISSQDHAKGGPIKKFDDGGRTSQFGTDMRGVFGEPLPVATQPYVDHTQEENQRAALINQAREEYDQARATAPNYFTAVTPEQRAQSAARIAAAKQKLDAVSGQGVHPTGVPTSAPAAGPPNPYMPKLDGGALGPYDKSSPFSMMGGQGNAPTPSHAPASSPLDISRFAGPNGGMGVGIGFSEGSHGKPGTPDGMLDKPKPLNDYVDNMMALNKQYGFDAAYKGLNSLLDKQEATLANDKDFATNRGMLMKLGFGMAKQASIRGGERGYGGQGISGLLSAAAAGGEDASNQVMSAMDKYRQGMNNLLQDRTKATIGLATENMAMVRNAVMDHKDDLRAYAQEWDANRHAETTEAGADRRMRMQLASNAALMRDPFAPMKIQMAHMAEYVYNPANANKPDYQQVKEALTQMQSGLPSLIQGTTTQGVVGNERNLYAVQNDVYKEYTNDNIGQGPVSLAVQARMSALPPEQRKDPTIKANIVREEVTKEAQRRAGVAGGGGGGGGGAPMSLNDYLTSQGH